MLKKPRIVRKNLRLDQDKLTQAKEMLGAKTETEAIDQLLDEYLLREEAIRGIREAYGKNLFGDVPDDDVFAPRSG
jgi:Arc/MetJ family transcription regulator